MTFGLRNVLGILDVHAGRPARKGLLFTGEGWSTVQATAYQYVSVVCWAHAVRSDGATPRITNAANRMSRGPPAGFCGGAAVLPVAIPAYHAPRAHAAAGLDR